MKGLKATRQVWDGVEIDDDTHWTVALVAALRLVVDGWVFPLTGLNMSETKVSRQEIAQQREDWLAEQ